jgi:hypothetical protein
MHKSLSSNPFFLGKRTFSCKSISRSYFDIFNEFQNIDKELSDSKTDEQLRNANVEFPVENNEPKEEHLPDDTIGEFEHKVNIEDIESPNLEMEVKDDNDENNVLTECQEVGGQNEDEFSNCDDVSKLSINSPDYSIASSNDQMNDILSSTFERKKIQTDFSTIPPCSDDTNTNDEDQRIDEPLIGTNEDLLQVEEFAGSKNAIESWEIVDKKELPMSDEKTVEGDKHILDKEILNQTIEPSFGELKGKNKTDSEKVSHLSTSDQIEEIHYDEELSMLNTVESVIDNLKEKDSEKGFNILTSEKDTVNEDLMREKEALNVEADDENKNHVSENEPAWEKEDLNDKNKTNLEYSNLAVDLLICNCIETSTETNEINVARVEEELTEQPVIVLENLPQPIDDVTYGATTSDSEVQISNEISSEESELSQDEKSSNIFVKTISCCYSCCCCAGGNFTNILRAAFLRCKQHLFGQG